MSLYGIVVSGIRLGKPTGRLGIMAARLPAQRSVQEQEAIEDLLRAYLVVGLAQHKRTR